MSILNYPSSSFTHQTQPTPHISFFPPLTHKTQPSPPLFTHQIQPMPPYPPFFHQTQSTPHIPTPPPFTHQTEPTPPPLSISQSILHPIGLDAWERYQNPSSLIKSSSDLLVRVADRLSNPSLTRRKMDCGSASTPLNLTLAWHTLLPSMLPHSNVISLCPFACSL